MATAPAAVSTRVAGLKLWRQLPALPTKVSTLLRAAPTADFDALSAFAMPALPRPRTGMARAALPTIEAPVPARLVTRPPALASRPARPSLPTTPGAAVVAGADGVAGTGEPAAGGIREALYALADGVAGGVDRAADGAARVTRELGDRLAHGRDGLIATAVVGRAADGVDGGVERALAQLDGAGDGTGGGVWNARVSLESGARRLC
jgi:hypothetical protein